MLHGRAHINVRDGEVVVRIDECYLCRGRRRKESLILGACLIFMVLAIVEFLILLAGGFS
jgi:hypothetical protein